MKIDLTKYEIETLKFYLELALIDAKGMRAVGVGSNESVSNIESVIKKISQ